MIAAGIFGFLIAPFISRMLPLFPPVVTGTIIIVIGISLMRVGINWAGGGTADARPRGRRPDGPVQQSRSYGALDGLGIALFVLLVDPAITRYAKGFVANVAVLLGIVAGAILAGALGKMHFEKVASAPWFGVVYPFQFGLPTFDLVASITMCLVMIVVMIESTGMFLALGEMTDRQDRPGGADQGPARRRRRHASSAASSTPSPTPRSRRTSGSSASPASARAG